MGLGKHRVFGALIAIAIALLPALVQPISTGAAGTGTLFGITGIGSTTLSKIDPVAGTVTPLATVGGGPDNSQVTNLTGDPGTHRIFALRTSVMFTPPDIIRMTEVILTINSQTDAISTSPPVNAGLGGLQFDTATGTLYALAHGPQGEGVAKVDPSTGAVTPVASIGPNGPFIDQMTISSQTHTIYVSHEDVSGPLFTNSTRIFTVNTQTNAVSSSPVLSRAIRTIIYDSSTNKLLGATECCPRDLMQIDPVSGAETFLGNIQSSPNEFFTVNMTTDPASHTLFTVLATPRTVGFVFDYHILSINTQTGASTLGPAMPEQTGSLYFESLATPPDTSPPTTSIALSPVPNAAGWNKSNVTVNLSATDPDGVADVATIQYSAAGAQTIAPTLVAGNAASFMLTAEGVTTVTYFAKDKAGNTELAHTRVIRIDKTPPTVTYAGNAGTYTVDQTVTITCTAIDPPNANGTPGSGLASSTCANVSAPAYTFPLGSNTLSASATDIAGNVGSGSTTFRVQVTFASLCALTVQFIESSPAFQALPPNRQAHWDKLCQRFDVAEFATDPEEKAELIVEYQELLPHLVRKALITPDQAGILLTLSQAL